MSRLPIVLLLVLASCGYGYSDGERSGIVTKFSYKGFIWKSWEGELVMGGMRVEGNAIAANVWRFHAADPEVVKAVQSAQEAGVAVTLQYRQWAMSPLAQDSDYDVVGVKRTAR